MLPFHLCQPGGGASCGACCGLYNLADHSRGAVRATLQRHTEIFRPLERSRAAYASAAEALKAAAPAPAFAEVRVCPLLGFIQPDGAPEQVGCLAHPKVTGGPDLRDCGVYTAQVCESFECPSFLWLTAGQASLIRAACPDWYLYGLIVTDVEFVRGCFRLLARQMGGEVDAERILGCPAALQAAGSLFSLKEQAAERPEGTVFGRFTPGSDGEPALRGIDYARLAAHAAPEDDVLLCLGLPVGSRDQLHAARNLVRGRITALVDALHSN